MFKNLKKLTKIKTRKNPMQQVWFHLSRSTGSIKLFKLVQKTTGNIKDCLEITLFRKKKYFAKHL